jgi:hypothetical protein
MTGYYSDTLTSTQGCDSIISLSLKVESGSAISRDITICEGSSFFTGGGWQTTPGTYTDTLISTAGCDSIITTRLNVNDQSRTILNIAICDGDSFRFGNNYLKQAGTFTRSLFGHTGCDSIIELHLQVLPEVSLLREVRICEGDSYFAGGKYNTIPGLYYDKLTGINNCDSIIITNLIVQESYFIAKDTSICEGDSVLLGTVYYSKPGLYQTEFHTSRGCDSLIRWNLRFRNCPVNALEIPAEKIVVYPNPFKEILYISGRFDKVQIYTLSGILIHEGCSKELNLSFLAPGLYIIRITTGKRTIYKKILRN